MKKQYIFLFFMLMVMCFACMLSVNDTPVYAETVKETTKEKSGEYKQEELKETQKEDNTELNADNMKETQKENNADFKDEALKETTKITTKESTYETSDKVSITVFGEATKEVKPDFAKVFVSINNVGNNCESAKKVTFENFSKLQDELSKLGITKEKIQLNHYYTSSCGCKCNTNACSAVLDFSVKVDDIGNIKNIVSKIEESENAKIRNFIYEIKENNVECNEVLKQAVENATAKAKKLTNRENLNIVEICEENNYFYKSIYKDYISATFDDFQNQFATVSARIKVKFQ